MVKNLILVGGGNGVIERVKLNLSETTLEIKIILQEAQSIEYIEEVKEILHEHINNLCNSAKDELIENIE